MTDYETLPQHLARAYPDGAPRGLVPIRLCPVIVFGADECDCCQAPAGYGLMDAASAWSDCNRADRHIYRRDEDNFLRLPAETIVVWATPDEAAKFGQVLGDMRGVEPRPRVNRFVIGNFDVRVEVTAYPVDDPDAQVREVPVPIPNDDPACACRLETDGLAFLGVFPDEACPYHGDGDASDGSESAADGTVDAVCGEVERERASMSPVGRLIAAEVDEAMENLLLYGQHPRLPDAPGVNWPTGLAPGKWSTVSERSIVLPDPGYVGQLQRGADPLEAAVGAVVEDERRSGRPIARSQWAPRDCTCPWPWPLDGRHILAECPRYEAPPKPIVGRNTRVGCQRYESGTWVHGAPHDCPRWAR